MVSLPYDDTCIANVAALRYDICTKDADAIWVFDCSEQMFHSYTSLDTGAGFGIWAGMPFWVNITSPGTCIWEVYGTVDTTLTYQLCPGLNMVSLPEYSTSITLASQLLSDIPNCTAVFRWTKSVNCASAPEFEGFFDLSDPLEDFAIYPRQALWVNVTAGGTWFPPNP